jgi:tol-pal system protein YbgF
MTHRIALIAIAAIVLQGCFASKSDFETLRTDVAANQRRAASTDSLQRVQINQFASLNRGIVALGDSVRALNARLQSSQTQTQGEVAGLRQDIAQLQDILGQSEQRIKEIRATLEDRATSVSADSATTAAGPGPAQLLQLGKDQMLKRSYSSGRDALNDLLTRFPTSDLAPDAIFEIAQSYRAENNLHAADSSYADLTSRFPDSPRVPSALYKRALILQSLGQPTAARRLLEDVRRRFPRSPEAALAQDRLRGIR